MNLLTQFTVQRNALKDGKAFSYKDNKSIHKGSKKCSLGNSGAKSIGNLFSYWNVDRQIIISWDLKC